MKNYRIKRRYHMKGYVVASGYMGYLNGEYVLFADEQEYKEIFSEEYSFCW